MEARPWHRWYDPGVPTTLDYPRITLPDLLTRTASLYPDKNALIFFNRGLTFRDLETLANRLGAALQELGVGKGDRVSIFLPNCPQTVIAYQAIWRAGGVAVPANPLYTAAEFAHQVADAGSKVAFCLTLNYPRVRGARPHTALEHVIVTNIKEYFPPVLRALFTVAKERKEGHRVNISGDPNTHWFQEVIASAPEEPQPVAVDPEDLACLMYTGGTTGVPKGAMLTHRNLVSNSRQGQAWSPGLVEGGEIMLTALPLTHSYAMTVCMTHSIDRGYTEVIVPDPRDIKGLLKVIDRQRPTLVPGVPALYAALANHPAVAQGKYDLTSIKQCMSGAAGLPPEVQRHFQEVTGGRLVEGYGLSETSPVTHANPLAAQDRIGTIGIPFPDTDARIVDEETETRIVGPGERGVLCISGPQVMRGYWHNPEETAAALRTDPDGTVWLHTGDVAVMDEDGFFHIVDRKKDLILAGGGLNVYPREIEDVLYEHPAVAEVGVIGVPVGSPDQRVKAFVVLKEGTSATVEELQDFCRERLARFKVPKFIEFRDSLPRTFVGKVLRRELAAEEQGRAQAQPEAGTG
ncbi:MAG TPA: long-chain fatty acid--CoA ligase [Acidimicrobiia bacterium]|nr:long-chain fatty acid--CoA ligase [Acidimicrobiia bacterium]